jgi:outer membrane protein assembly factor BamB
MKNSITVFYTVILSIILFSCKKNGDDDIFLPPPPVTCDTCAVSEQKLQIVWQQPLWIDTGQYNSFPPVYWNGKILFSVEFDDREILRMRDAATGSLLWEWDDHLGGGNSIGIYSSFVHGNKILYCSGNEVYAIDLENGETIWGYKNPTGKGEIIMNVIGDYVYHVHRPDEGGIHYTESYLVRAHVNQGVWDTIYTLKEENGYRPDIYPPGYWVSSANDTILVFQNRQWHFSPNDGKIDLIAYNLTQDSTLYVLSDLDPQGESNVRPPLIWGDKIYFAGKRTMYCIDVQTGEILWKKLFTGFGETLYTCNWLVVGNKLIVKPDNQNIYALDPLAGNEIWKKTDSGATCFSDMVYHDGRIYLGCWGTLTIHAIDVETGEDLWNLESPNRENGYPTADFATGVAISPELGYLYTADLYFALCIKLPER